MGDATLANKALPLSYLGIRHYFQALVETRLQPLVVLVDFRMVMKGRGDLDNCTECQKVIDPSVLSDEEDPDTEEGSVGTVE